jgi:iron complex transport system permease protein
MKWKLALLGVLFLAFTAAHFWIGFGFELPPQIAAIRLSVYLEEIGVALVLSMAGLVLQTLLVNPLAEPYVLGVSGGASLGAVLSVFFSLTPFLFFRTAFAMTGAVGISLVIFAISNRKTGFSIGTALLAGIAFNALFSGLIMLLQSLLLPNDLQSSIRWLMGNVDYAAPAELVLLYAAAAVLLFYLLRYGRELDIYLSGDEMAQAVGVDTGRLKLTGFLAVSVATGIAVSLTGMIGFLGLVVPHIVKMLFGPGHKRAILPLLLTSSTLMLGAGVASRLLSPGTVFPVGIITSLIGAPFFIFILLRKYRGA